MDWERSDKISTWQKFRMEIDVYLIHKNQMVTIGPQLSDRSMTKELPVVNCKELPTVWAALNTNGRIAENSIMISGKRR